MYKVYEEIRFYFENSIAKFLCGIFYEQLECCMSLRTLSLSSCVPRYRNMEVNSAEFDCL